MYKIDAIKSQARRHAWANNDGKNYNPFARSRSQRTILGDEEKDLNLRPYVSVDNAPSAIETDRNQRTREEYPHPQHHNTAPPDSATTERPRTADRDLYNTHDKDSEESKGTTSSGGTARGTTLGNVDTNTDYTNTNGTTPRYHTVKKRNWKKFGRKEEVEEPVEDDDDDDSNGKNKKTFWQRLTYRDPSITVMGELKTVLFGSWINILLVAVPVGFAMDYGKVNGVANFVVNFIAIIPLAAMLSFATEELAMYVGETLGGLLNASFGNATELIVGVIALTQNKILIVQTSLIGSMLSNLLLVLGMCFYGGGYNRVTQFFNVTVAQTAASLLALAIGSLIIPTAFQIFGTTPGDPQVAPISRGTAVILLVVYCSYLYFQLKTHTEMYNAPSQKSEKKKSSKKAKGEVMRGIAQMGAGSAASAGGQVNQSNLVQNDDDEEEKPSLTVLAALLTLLVATVLIAFCSEFMVSGIDSISGSVSPEFIGLILIPIVGNAAGE